VPRWRGVRVNMAAARAMSAGGGLGFEICSGSEAGSYLRLIDSCITQLTQGPSRTCTEIKEEEEKKVGVPHGALRGFRCLGYPRVT